MKHVTITLAFNVPENEEYPIKAEEASRTVQLVVRRVLERILGFGWQIGPSAGSIVQIEKTHTHKRGHPLTENKP